MWSHNRIKMKKKYRRIIENQSENIYWGGLDIGVVIRRSFNEYHFEV